ncbi:MAG: DNA mismatch repair protein MutS [Phycisphaerae bacterium]
MPHDVTMSGIPPAAAPRAARLTPAMRQYVEQKRRVGDAVLLFRMGDFYETFYDDAVLCSKVLGLTLTSRSKGDNPVPLAGIPYHALDNYLNKLVAAGHKVAISEQVEDPKKAKGIVKRDIVRIVTAGTLTDDGLLRARDDNTLAAMCFGARDVGLAVVELAAGRFQIIDVGPDGVLDELARLRPAEVLISDEPEGAAGRVAGELKGLCGTIVTRRPAHEFTPYRSEKALLEHFGVGTLAGFGFERPTTGLRAAGAIMAYLQETQKTDLAHITALTRRVSGDAVQIDHVTWRSLEIDQTLRGQGFDGTLRHAVDRTVHPIGARRLRGWLRAPLMNADEIVARQDAVAYLVEGDACRSHVRQRLREMADVERIAARIALARATPRDLAGLATTLAALPDVAARLRESRVRFLAGAAADLEGLDAVADILGRAVVDAPPTTVREGGIFRDGYDAELDRLRGIGRDGQSWLAAYQRRQVEATGIANLKVGFNRVFGYYIEVSNSARRDVPADYVRKQTVKNAERYITDELKQYESEVLTAQERANELEYRLFEALRETVAGHMKGLLRVADAIGRVDCVAGLAELATQRRYVRPAIVSDGRLDIRAGRHPVLDHVLGDDLVPNDTVMNAADARVFVITGPNMAGKSTYIRQVALLTLLAQTGSFVPAASMTLSLVDRIFARVGASDEIMRGRSTFMVEMTEAANILHNATDRSLVVLDELGRGTSTFDGLALAWAITENLANEIKCRTLVATHYHELTELAELLDGVRNYNVAVREYAGAGDAEGGIAFLHAIVAGGTNKSYGVQVARLAGIPEPVVGRSREILAELQRGFSRESRTPELSGKKTKDDAQLTLFREPDGADADALLAELRDVDPDRLTPLDALQRLQAWKDRFCG